MREIVLYLLRDRGVREGYRARGYVLIAGQRGRIDILIYEHCISILSHIKHGGRIF